MTIDFLLTTVGCSEEEIINKIVASHLFGNVVVGNQKSEKNFVSTIVFEGVNITIVNQTSVGTSKNRNEILKYAKSDFVTFWDDDMIFNEKEKNTLFSMLSNDSVSAIRFNVCSLNEKRPIKQLKSYRNLKFANLRSFGVWGIFFRLADIKKNNLYFNNNLGPGTKFNHGEDTAYLFDFFQTKLKMTQVDCVIASTPQDSSCWFDCRLEDYFLAQGFVYAKIYGKLAKFYGFLYLLKHKKRFKKIFLNLKYFNKGVFLYYNQNESR